MNFTLKRNGRAKGLVFTTDGIVKPERPRLNTRVQVGIKHEKFEARRKFLIGQLFNFV